MKTINICSGLLLSALLISTNGFSQDQLFASAEAPPRDGTITTTEPTAEGEKKKEEEAKTFTLSGTIDTYFRSSFGTMNPYMGNYGPSTSFADLKGFGLGMANLIASYSGEKAGFTADLVFGPRGQAAVFGTASGQAVI
ncbi:MAG TPA: outer membrane beta-barrel protein, partial [Sphingobacteriaceae bacterium]